jgi:branched-chain amino acid aminotransferase
VAYIGSGRLFAAGVSTGVLMIAKQIATSPVDMLHVCSAAWTRLADTAAAPRVKAGANYHNVRLAQVQAQLDGYDDAVLLNSSGKVCELPLANVFVAIDGKLVTPDTTSGILEGITRKAVLELANDIGIPTGEREVDRSELYLADEFLHAVRSYVLAQ